MAKDMTYRFTIEDIEQLESTVPLEMQKRTSETIPPHVVKILGTAVTKSEAYTAGKLVGWVVLAGKDKLRMLPQYFMDSLSFDEKMAHTFADKIIAECKTELEAVVKDINLDAIRAPWKGKVDPSVFSPHPSPLPPGERGTLNDMVIPKPEEPPQVSGLHTQDPEEKIGIRLRMIEQLAGIDFKGDMAEKFRHAVRPALKGIKNSQETARTLALVPEKGGLGMSQSHVDEVIDLIERLRAKEQEISARAEMKKPQTPKSFLPMVEDEEKMMPVVQPAGATKLNTLIQQSAADRPLDLQSLATGRADSKMHDVVARPLTMGPLDEIRTMTLTDFRRLGAKAAAAAEKIKERLSVLRQDGIDQYAAGIKAWRESPFYSVYIGMINEALKNGQPLEEIAGKNPNDPARFTSEELQSVVELNKSLRF